MNHILTIRTDEEPPREVFSAHVGELTHLDIALVVLSAIKAAMPDKPRKTRSDAGRPRSQQSA